MTKFSTRNRYDPKDNSAPQLESAPIWMRKLYIRRILNDLIFVDHDSRFTNTESAPIGIKDLIEEFSLSIKQEPEENFLDSFYCLTYLSDMIENVEWFHFYDFVEFLYQKLKEKSYQSLPSPHHKKHFQQNYLSAVNDLFKENKIGWRLKNNGHIVRETPRALEEFVESTESRLSDEFEPARIHYKKALHFVTNHPIDPENSIKEIISSIESAGKVFSPKASTLGDVIKQMKKEGKLPTTLIDLIDKFYILSNSEPAIRHGSTKISTISAHDAELCFYIGVAIIRYLLAKNNKLIT